MEYESDSCSTRIGSEETVYVIHWFKMLIRASLLLKGEVSVHLIWIHDGSGITYSNSYLGHFPKVEIRPNTSVADSPSYFKC